MMSATWSLTYLDTDVSQAKLFEVVTAAFQSELNGKLYGLEWSENRELIPVKLEHSFVKQFENREESEIALAVLYEHYNDLPSTKRVSLPGNQERISQGILKIDTQGLLVYPRYNSLYTLADTIISLHIYESGRLRRQILESRLQEKSDPDDEILFHYMNFLKQLTRKLSCEAVHIMFDRNPAGRGTSVHFYTEGVFIDDYYYENIEAIGNQMIELPNKPDYVRYILGGRFAFLTNQPRMHRIFNDEEYAHYFDGEDLSPHRTGKWDVFNLRSSDLYVPFWMDTILPFGGICCVSKELPPDFLQQYQIIDG